MQSDILNSEEVPLAVLENIRDYLPKTSLRAVSKQFIDKTYCDMAGVIYNDDLVNATKHNQHIIYYKDNDNLTYARLYKSNGETPGVGAINISYQMTKKDKYYRIRTKSFEDYDLILEDIDVMSKYNIMKTRGCEDTIENFSKIKTMDFLLKTFKDSFNPDMMSDMIYLYIYLYSNLTLLNYPLSKMITRFDMTKLPSDSLLEEIYDMYNLLYVHLNLLEL